MNNTLGTCFKCGKQIVKERSIIIEPDSATTGLTPLYECYSCHNINENFPQMNAPLMTFTTICYRLKDTDSVDDIKVAVEDAYQRALKMELVSSRTNDNLVDQADFSFLVRDIYLVNDKIYCIISILNTESGKKLYDSIKTSKNMPEVKVLWGWEKESIPSESIGKWETRAQPKIVDLNGEVPMISIEHDDPPAYRTKLIIDSLYVRFPISWWKKWFKFFKL